ncbi:MAG: hypothetical protein HY882_09280, partial [Deltaproteobacteria bacterium]|nr:hypothetical protein [Deltaproteobacteria bacterium]
GALTPPVCVAVYIASGMAGSDWLKTAWIAVRLGIAGLIVPFMFVYNPVLLMEGPVLEIIQAFATALLGVVVLAMGIEGEFYIRGIRWNLWQRALFISTFPLLLDPGLWTDLIGLGIVAAVLISHGGFRERMRNNLGRRDVSPEKNARDRGE